MVYGVLAVATGIMDIAFYARVERHTASADDGACQWYSERDVRLHAAGLSLCRAVGP